MRSDLDTSLCQGQEVWVNGQIRGRTRLTFVATLCSFLSTFVVWNFCSLHTFACHQIERDAVAAQLMHPAVSNAGEPIIA
jgi:hypothetical protein